MAQVMHGAEAPELDWELLYDTHAPKLRRVIQRRTGAALVDDVLQETFLRAFKGRSTIDPTRPIGPWLITIALRTAVEFQRNQLRTVETTDETVDHHPSPDSVDDELLNRARRLGIRHAFSSLNTRQRRLLQLVTLEGMSYERVAGGEDMTTDAVKAALARARTNFKASYTGFERESGLFGGAVLLGLLTRLRERLYRYQALVSEHVAGVGAAAATVVVVAVAVAPVVTQPPSQAREAEVGSVGAAGPAGSLHGSEATATTPATDAGITSLPTPRSPGGISANGDALKARASASTAKDGAHFSTSTQTDVSTGSGKAHDEGTIDTYCDAGHVAGTVCAVADLLPESPSPG